jgi:L-threonylcarbamoyladenylate synthase
MKTHSQIFCYQSTFTVACKNDMITFSGGQMRVIPLDDIKTHPELYADVNAVLEQGGIVCIPTFSGYKLAADFSSPKAVIAMLQAKRRVKNAPSLVFVPDHSWVKRVAEEVSDEAEALMKALWPGPVTLLFEANRELPSTVRKSLTKAKGWLGVRVPDDEVSHEVVKAFGKPILVSSANLARKNGEWSVAQVRKNFGRTVDLLVDSGDLSEGQKSTLIDLTKGKPSIVRPGVVSAELVERILAN